ncbi:DUF6207 family protein [Streptomyces sp. NPDC047725]|uniref:DUF6207 family protein n=1 Tax=Streptomyces sp. NPDC047725 TaxID=3365487 RepID=UPI003713A705
MRLQRLRWAAERRAGPPTAVVGPPSLVVVDVAAADDETAFALHAALAAQGATTSVERTTRDTGQAGVWLRCYLDLRQPIDPPGSQREEGLT